VKALRHLAMGNYVKFKLSQPKQPTTRTPEEEEEEPAALQEGPPAQEEEEEKEELGKTGRTKCK